MPNVVPGSFRDPSGHVFEADGQIFRTISPEALRRYQICRPVLSRLAEAGKLTGFEEHDPAKFVLDGVRAALVLEHPRLACWSYPYEWSFALLRDAALFHLDLHLELLEANMTLVDASAYNVQFLGTSPIFVDHLSIRPYVPDEFWHGQNQFCEQFLFPLLLRSYCGVPHNSWYRGNLDGIPLIDFAKLLPLRRSFSLRALMFIIMPAQFQKRTASHKNAEFTTADRRFPKAAFVGVLKRLRKWITSLAPPNNVETTWARYAKINTYTDAEAIRKRAFVAEFMARDPPATVVDLGCNTGDFAVLCLERGATRVIGFDFDQQALDLAQSRAKAGAFRFTPLFLDAKNPSPDQGWQQRERSGFGARFSADAVLALASSIT